MHEKLQIIMNGFALNMHFAPSSNLLFVVRLFIKTNFVYFGTSFVYQKTSYVSCNICLALICDQHLPYCVGINYLLIIVNRLHYHIGYRQMLFVEMNMKWPAIFRLPKASLDESLTQLCIYIMHKPYYLPTQMIFLVMGK